MSKVWKFAFDRSKHHSPLFGSTVLHFKNFVVAWTIVWCTFLVCGGIFHAIEGGKDRRSIIAHEREYKTLMSSVQAMDDDTAEEDIEFVLDWMVDHGDCTIPNLNKRNWDFSSSMYIVFQLVSTIGYGVFAPATPSGRCFAAFVVLAFLPLFNHAMGLSQTYVGNLLRWLQERICKGETLHAAKVYVCIAVVLLFSWMCLGALLFLHRKDVDEHHLDFADGLYFTYITVSTIGLGDFSYNTGMTEPMGILWSIVGIAFFNETMDCVSPFLDALGTKFHVVVWNFLCGKEEFDNQIEPASSRTVSEVAVESSDKSVDPTDMKGMVADEGGDAQQQTPQDELTAAAKSLTTILVFFVLSLFIGGAIVSAFEYPREQKFNQQ